MPDRSYNLGGLPEHAREKNLFSGSLREGLISRYEQREDGRMAERVRRVDRIASILKDHGGRAKVRDIVRTLGESEDTEIGSSAIWVAIQGENSRLEELGKRRQFATKRNGDEEHGWISFTRNPDDDAVTVLEESIRKANEAVDSKIRKRLQDMDWRTFESTFLSAVLEKLGFQDVVTTQATRDGGVDARVTYQRGVVEARAIVSAKHWNKQSVPVSEVRQIRGIKGDEDTALIITTGRFTEDARADARPGQNQRVVFLIDGDRLVEICKQHSIGVRRRDLPQLLVVDELELSNDTDENEDADDVSEQPVGVQRLRDAMLGDDEKGLSIRDIAKLTGLEENTVKNYLSTDRRQSLLDRIREDPRTRARALKIVSKRRS